MQIIAMHDDIELELAKLKSEYIRNNIIRGQ